MRRGRQVILGVVLGVCACLVFTGSVQAVLITFYGITDNDPGSSNIAVGEDQLFVEVTNGGPSVTFTFYNVGLSQCTITDVYFDDGTLLELTGLIDKDDGTGGDLNVDFSTPASPANLPKRTSRLLFASTILS